MVITLLFVSAMNIAQGGFVIHSASVPVKSQNEWDPPEEGIIGRLEVNNPFEPYDLQYSGVWPPSMLHRC